jgi:hypothetical protein
MHMIHTAAIGRRIGHGLRHCDPYLTARKALHQHLSREDSIAYHARNESRTVEYQNSYSWESTLPTDSVCT